MLSTHNAGFIVGNAKSESENMPQILETQRLSDP